MSDTTTLYEWVNPAEFTPENGWVQDLIDGGRLRERTFRLDVYCARTGDVHPCCPVCPDSDRVESWIEVTDATK